MGCGGSKKAAAPAEAPKEKTLLDQPAEKQVPENENVTMFLDCLGSSECLKVSDDSKLKVMDVQGGPIGGWNNRAYTDKVRVGDIVVQLRKVGANDWISDAAQMLEALRKQGPFEVAVARGKQEDPAPKEATAAPEAAAAPAADAAPEAEQKQSEPATDAQAQNEDKSAVQADSANTEAAAATDAPEAPEELAVEVTEGPPAKACGGFFGVC